MKVSYNWLKESLDLSGIDINELAERITLTGIEVEGIEGSASAIDHLVIGQVLECDPIEGSDHLNLTQVDAGEETLQIVCGAPNVKQGQKVIVAKPGAVLPGNFKIKETKMMGNPSNGMICSLEELGFSDSVIPKFAEEGIYILPVDAIVGENASSYIGVDDAVIEFDITPNRADALSMRGVSHEVAAILDQTPEFIQPDVKENTSEQIEDYISVKVEKPEDNPIYKMRVIKDVTIGESPLWLQRKLMNAGMRPIDSVVDVTNYIMLEYGQPLHSFDYDKVDSNEIVVRRAEDGEVLETLDQHERKLSSENLVITNGEKPIGIAGVMGGANSQITEETQTIALESAVFNPALIRRTANAMNLRSEASSRYEKGINLATVQDALDLAAQLIGEIAGGEVVSGTASVENIEAKNTEVTLSMKKLNDLIGDELSVLEVENIFDRLGFGHQISEEVFTVSIPPRRWDISIDADLVEEVARLHGYNKIPSTLPFTESVPGELNESQRLNRYLRQYLENSGLAQGISYVLTTPEKATLFRFREKTLVQLAYPMSEEHQVLRQSVVTGLLDNAEYNNARQMNDVSLYEIGRVFYQEEGSEEFVEKDHVAGLVTGSLSEASWIEAEEKVDFYTIKGIVEEMLEAIGLRAPIHYVAASDMETMHPGRTAKIYLGNEPVGFVGQIHPLLADERDLDESYVFELDLEELVRAEKDPIIYNTIPKYPGTSRDVALLVDGEVTHQEVIKVIETYAGQWLNTVRLFDLYQGENIEEGKKSIAYSLFYQNPESTLIDEEVDKDFHRVKDALIEELNAEIR